MAVGSWNVVINVTDSGSLSNSTTISIGVSDINDPPNLTEIGNLTAYVGVPLFYEINASDDDLFTVDTQE